MYFFSKKKYIGSYVNYFLEKQGDCHILRYFALLGRCTKNFFLKNFCEFNGLGSFLGTCPASDRDDRKPPSVVVSSSSSSIFSSSSQYSKGVAKVHMTQAKHSGDWGRRKQQDNTPKHRRHKKVTLRGGLICTLYDYGPDHVYK